MVKMKTMAWVVKTVEVALDVDPAVVEVAIAEEVAAGAHSCFSHLPNRFEKLHAF